MERYPGVLYPTGRAVRIAAEVWRDDRGRLWLESTLDPAAEVDIVGMTPQVGRVAPLLTFRNGSRFLPDAPLPDAVLGTRTTGILQWFEGTRISRAVLFVVILIAFALFVRSLIPVMSDVLVHLVPKSWDTRIGTGTIEFADDLFLDPSDLTAAHQARVTALFEPLADTGLRGEPYAPRLLFRRVDFLGANAFALPGGTVVVTDDLVRLMDRHPDELQAILAHELGHVRLRHGMRNLLNTMGWSGLVFVAGMDSGTLEGLFSGYEVFSQLSYSRAFELEADRDAARMMRGVGADPLAMGRALSRLEESACGLEGCDEGDAFSTHPDIAKRLRELSR